MTAAFADCAHVECPWCRAPAGQLCTYVWEGERHSKHAPCWARLRAAERALGAS